MPTLASNAVAWPPPTSGSLPGRRSPRLAGVIDGLPATFEPGQRIFDESDRADSLYEVMGGMVRTLRLGQGGRRMICEFIVPGELFGLESAATYRCSAEAVDQARMMRYERARLESRALVDRAVATQLQSWFTLRGEQATGRLLLRARASALQKIASFLLDLAGRMNAEDRLRLPMSRYDIADYLCLSSETVSRGFTALRQRGLISIDGRMVNLLEPRALSQLDAAFN